MKGRTEQILRSDARCRSDDRWLLLTYWAEEGLHLTPAQTMKFLKCTSAETITRQRRLLREKYPPNKEVDKIRFNKYLDNRFNRAFEYAPAEED